MILALLFSGLLCAQAPYYTSVRPLDTAQDIPANRGSAAVWQLLQKLHTRASMLMLTAHPDDEDGGMLTYESRGRGTRVALLTLNRGEGGANVMSPDYFDALGLVRTMELLEAGRHYGVDQYFTRVTDYGYSKTKAEALGQWTRDRVLADCVRVVRMVRPLVVTSVFVGGPSDGHGNHEVAGEMAREVFAAAGDPARFPEQIRAGLQPWAPLKYYARVRGQQPAHLQVPVSQYDPLLGTTYSQLAREGLGMQKSQNGGPMGASAPPRPSVYRRFESHVGGADKEQSFFDGIDTSLIALAGSPEERTALVAIGRAVEAAMAAFDARDPARIAPHLAEGLKRTDALLAAAPRLSHELAIKRAQFHQALAAALGVSLHAEAATGRVAVAGQQFDVRVNVRSGLAVLKRKWLEATDGEPWKLKESDAGFQVTVPQTARLTRPYFQRPHLGFPYYDQIDEQLLGQPLRPYPLTAWAEFEVNGVVFHAGQIVQTTQRVTGQGSVSEPLVVGPAISVTLQPRAGIVPLGAKSFELTVALRSNRSAAAEGSVRLVCPQGWRVSPERQPLSTDLIRFTVTPAKLDGRRYECSAVATHNGREYREGYQITGYPGLRPYFLYRAATHTTSGVDVKIAPNLKVAYVTGSGDEVAEGLANLGIQPAFLTASDLAAGDLSRFDAILLGVRAYAVCDDLKANNARLLDYVKNGGVLIVQYNTPEFDHNYGPYPYVMGNNPEEVTDEQSKMEILDPAHPVFTVPNRITLADFDHWIEERGSKFWTSWDSRYTPLLSTQDAGQPPQKGGLMFATYGKGFYVYNAYAFYRQMPEGVPGAYRLLANMLSLKRTAR
ncbi:MAG: PIG-L family deacetylase [Acidobacteria bacterium]|nr:PIG-L family deacetylase [Acidobacteriota bacterium]